MSDLIKGISKQIYCPHFFRAGGIEGCTAGRTPPCAICDHPDKRIENVKWKAVSTE